MIPGYPTSNVQHRYGVSTTELLVAVALLAVLTTAIGQFAVYVNQAIARRELFRLVQWELDNARQLIGSWHPNEITERRMTEIPFSNQLKQRFQNPAWTVDIQPAEIRGLESGNFTSIRLGICATFGEQKINPAELIFWAPAASEGADGSDPASPRSITPTEPESQVEQKEPVKGAPPNDEAG